MTVGELKERLEALNGITDDYEVFVPSLIPQIEGEYIQVSDIEITPEYREIKII